MSEMWRPNPGDIEIIESLDTESDPEVRQVLAWGGLLLEDYEYESGYNQYQGIEPGMVNIVLPTSNNSIHRRSVGLSMQYESAGEYES